MATSFMDIYCLNKLIKNDPRLKKLTEVEFIKLCFGYLKFAISYFMYDCRKNLIDKIEPSYQEYSFLCNGIDNEFLMSPSPRINSNFYVTLKSSDVEIVINDYLFDALTGILKLSIVPKDGAILKVTSYIIGNFVDDLDDRESVILAEAMNIPYLEESKNDQNAMKYIVSGKSLRFFSQANHIDSAIGNYNEQSHNIVDGLISEYSYKGSADKYRGLAKRGRWT